jgi:2-amino-4-hydroxy-6-hydroxymethyldihydropteridine diphosphokinase
MKTAYLLLGTNLGDRRNNFLQACALLEKKAGKISKISNIYETEPWGFSTSQWFYNMVLELQTELTPKELLIIILEIEKIMGRERTDKGTYENRIIDIDLLLFENQIIKEESLEIPHPRMHLRKFTLLPFVEISPDIIHPVLKKKMKQLLDECKDDSKVSNIGSLHNEPPYSQ